MRLTKTLIFVALFSLLSSSAAMASKIKLVSSVDKKILTLDDTISLTVTVTGITNPSLPNIPDLDSFSLIFGPSVSCKAIMANGVSTVAKGFTYVLRPNYKGKLFIGEFTFRHQGRLYKSNTNVINVVDNINNIQKQKPAKKLDLSNLVFIELVADKHDAYVLEQILLSVKLFCKRGLTITDINYNVHALRNVVSEKLKEKKQYQVVRNGILYNVIEIRSLIFPVISNEIIIGPAKLDCNLVVKPRASGGHGFYSDLFNDPIINEIYGTDRDRLPVTRESATITLHVKPFPERGKPHDFNGAAGNYTLDVDLKPRSVKVGDPITVTMSITGKGNVSTVAEPALHLLNNTDFKVYPSETSYSVKKSEEGLTGKKIFRKVIEPQSYKITKSPGISFSFFNFDLNEYKTIVYNPVPISVSAPAFDKPMHLSFHNASQDKSHPYIIANDIFPIMTNLTSFNNRWNLLQKAPILAPILITPVVLLVFSIFFQHYRGRAKKDRINKIDRHPHTTARKMLLDAEKISAEIEPDESYSIISKALFHYLSCKLAITTPTTEPSVVENILRDRNVPEKTINKLRTLLELCDYGRYARVTTSENDIHYALNSAVELIKLLETEIKQTHFSGRSIL